MDIHMSFIVHFDWMESSEGKAAIKKSLKKACKTKIKQDMNYHYAYQQTFRFNKG